MRIHDPNSIFMGHLGLGVHVITSEIIKTLIKPVLQMYVGETKADVLKQMYVSEITACI